MRGPARLRRLGEPAGSARLGLAWRPVAGGTVGAPSARPTPSCTAAPVPAHGPLFEAVREEVANRIVQRLFGQIFPRITSDGA